MPRNVDPGTIQVGKGLAPEGTVEDNSLRRSERDVDPLRVHIHDSSRAHMAEAIGIKDEGDCYTSDDVEGALQEICAGSGAGRLNGLISGGTFNELGNAPNGSGAPVALVPLTLGTPTEVALSAGVLVAGGLTVTLPDAAVSYFIYVDCDAASPAYRTLQFTAGTPPEVESATGVEHVMIARVDCDGAAQITAWQDARFFVRNLDRKVQYSSRNGENVDAWSEGCFATLESFFFWMQFYGDTGTSEEQKGTVLIRGTHNLSATLTVPSNHLQFIGDGEAVLTSGTLTAPLIDVSNRSDILFRGITFARSAGETAAITGSGTISQVKIENCSFAGGFPQCVTLTGASSVMVQGCSLVGFSGVGLNFDDCENVTVEGGLLQGSSSTAGVQCGATTACAGVVISNVEVSNTDYGVRVYDTAEVRIVYNSFSTAAQAAINLQGLCIDYAIQGNVIDGSLGASEPTSTGVFVQGNATGVAARGVISTNVIRRCHDGILAVGFDNTNLLDSLVISGNVLSEIAHDQDVRADTFSGVGTKGIGLELCLSVTVAENVLEDVGSIAGVAFGDPVYSLPVYVRNCQQILVSGNQIRTPQSFGIGESAGMVFATGKQVGGFLSSLLRVEGNLLTFNDANNSSKYGILFVASDATVVPVFNEVSVSRNSLKAGTGTKAVNSGVLFTTADIVTGVLTGGTFSDVHVAGNHLENHREYGVAFYLLNTSESHDNRLNNLTVEDNNLTGDTPTSQAVGVFLAAKSTAAAYKSLVEGVSFQGNVIRGFGYGVRCTVEDSNIAQPSVCRDISLDGNHVYDLSTVPASPKSIGVSFTTTGVGISESTNVSLSGNVIRGDDTPEGVAVQMPGHAATGLRVDGNLCELGNGVATIDRGIELVMGDNAATRSLRNVSFSGNQVRIQNANAGGFALHWSLNRIGVSQARITNNILVAGGQDALVLAHQGDAGAFEGLTVEGNTISDFAGGEGLLFDLSSTELSLQQISFNRNQIMGPHDTTNTAKASLRLVATQTAGSSFRGVQVEGNMIGSSVGNYPRRGISLAFPTQTGVIFQWENISISDNDVQMEFAGGGVSVGVDLLLRQVQATPSFAENVRVEQNTIQVQASGAITALTSKGIQIETTCNVRGLSISSNQVDCANSQSYFDHGIRLYHTFSTAEAEQGIAPGPTTNYVVGTTAGVFHPDFRFPDPTSDDFNAVSWEAVSICANQVRISAGQSAPNPASDAQRGALSLQHVRVLTGPVYLGVCLWGLVCSGNVLRSPKTNSVTSAGNALEMFGFRTNLMGVYAAWPNGGSSTDAQFVQEGWAVTGNSSTDFAREDGSAPGTFNGQCVKLRQTAATATSSGINSSNTAQDNGVSTGWDDLQLLGGTLNSNTFPRTY